MSQAQDLSLALSQALHQIIHRHVGWSTAQNLQGFPSVDHKRVITPLIFVGSAFTAELKMGQGAVHDMSKRVGEKVGLSILNN